MNFNAEASGINDLEKEYCIVAIKNDLKTVMECDSKNRTPTINKEPSFL
jgi:hypothetical protein